MPKSRFVLHLLSCLAALPLWADAVADIAELLRKGDAKSALERSDDALAKSPRDMRLRFLRGVALAEQGRQPEAIQVFSALTVDHPNQPEAYNNLAVLYAQQGQLDKARAALQMAIQTNPAYATAQANLSDVYAKLAAQAYDKALQLDKAAPAPQAPPKLALVKDLYTSADPARGNPAAAAAAKPAVVVTPKAAKSAEVPVMVPSPLPVAKPTPVPTPSPSPTLVPTPAPASVKAVPATPLPPTPVLAKPTPPAPVPSPAGVTATAKAESSLPTKVVDAGKAVESKSSEIRAEGKPASAPSDDEAQINAMLQAWAQAWAAKRVPEYLGFYAKQFRTPKGLSRNAWEQQRRDRIEGVRKIDVRVSNVKVQLENGIANVRFVQHYRSDRLESSTGKTLRLERVGGRWLIVDERVG